MSGIISVKAKRFRWVWLAVTFIILVALVFYVRNYTQDSADLLTTEERDWLKAHPVIRLAPDPDFPPVESFDKSGNYTGIAADHIALIEKKLGIRFTIIRLNNWDEIISKAKNRQIDMFAATKNPRRSEYLLFTRSFIELPAAIIAREKVKDPLTLEKLKGMKVSVVSGYAIHDFIAVNYPELNLDVVPDVQTGLRKVSFGMSDALVENLATATYFIEKEAIANLRVAGESGYGYSMAFASRKDWPQLNLLLEKALAQISSGEKKTITKKWLPLESDSLFASEAFRTATLIIFGTVILLIAGVIAWNRALAKQVSRRTVELEKELVERNRAENALRESEEKFRVLAETSPAAIFLYQGEKPVYVNPSVTRLTGYTEQEFLEMNFWDWIHENYHEQVRQYGMARQRGETVPAQYEVKCVSKSGEEKWVFISAGCIEYSGVRAGIASIFDITDRKRMEDELQHARNQLEKRVKERTAELAATVEALRESEGAYQKLAGELDRKQLLLRTLIDSIPDLIFYKDNNGFYLGCNKAFTTFAGRSEKDLTGRTDQDIFPREVAESFRVMDRIMLFEGLPRRNEEWIVYPDGRRVLLDTLKTPYYDQDGEIIGLIGISRDITERNWAEEQLRLKKHQLEVLNSTLESRVQAEVAKNREKDHLLIQQNRQAALGETLDHIAHQWKQPINTISLIVQDIGESYLAGELTEKYVYETVGKILDLLEHMAQTISVFRDFYRPEKEKTTFRIKESIDKALIFVEPALKYHHVAVELDADPELAVIGYPKEYAQVLLNILTNARDIFNERKVERPLVKVKAYAVDQKAVVTITDNAGGIPEAIIGKIFDLYFTTKESSGGTGIGLYMSKNIIEKNMGGALSAGNVNSGAQFRIELDIPEGH
jgi:PAS domain S-box-containing protein